MKTWARIEGDTVAETIELSDDLVPGKDIFHPDLDFADITGQPDVVGGWVRSGGGFAAPTTPDPSADQTKVDLRRYAATRRFEAETSGIKVGRIAVATDRESQSLVAGAMMLVQADPDMTIAFKTARGSFVDLDADKIREVFLAVTRHAQACRSVEADLSRKIDDEAVTSLSEIDAASWPA